MCRVTDDDDKHQRPLLVWPQPSTLCVGGPVLKCTSYNLAPLDCGLAGRRKPRPWPNKFTNRRIITGPRNGPVLFCSLASVIVVCNAAGRQPGRPAAGCAGSRYSMAGQSWYVSLGRQLVRYRYVSVSTAIPTTNNNKSPLPPTDPPEAVAQAHRAVHRSRRSVR